jgi:bifunctional UDP-N-acetylglucosamine pyrophosphorylase / glucosamine-1-phosphate N-acetyltransferase
MSNTHNLTANNIPKAAVIMAAGKGTRMRSSVSKVLHEVAGIPMIARVIGATLAAGISRVVVIIGHQSEAVKECVHARFPEADIRWAIQAEQKGTAHAVMCAQEALDDFDGQVWILSGDVPTLSSRLLITLSGDYADHALIVTGMRLEAPKSYGRLLKNDEGSLYAIREAKDCTPEERLVREVNAGLYRIDAKLLFEGLKTVQTNNAQGEYYLTDLVGYAWAQKAKIACPVLTGSDADELEGVNDRIDLAFAEERAQRSLAEELMRSGVTLLRPKTLQLSAEVMVAEDVLIEADVTLVGRSVIATGVTVERGCWIKDCEIGEGTVIKAYSHLEGAKIGAEASVGPFARLREGTILHDQVKVGNFVETKKTTLEAGAKASHLSYLGDAHIGKKANVGAGTITCNYDGYQKHKTVVGAGAFIGSDTQLVAPVTIGEGAFVAAGTTVTGNVPDHALALTRPKTIHKEGWAALFHDRMAILKK